MGDAKLLSEHPDMGASWHSMVLLQHELQRKHPQKMDRGYLFFQPEVNERHFWSEWVTRSSWTNIPIWELLGTQWFCFKMNFNESTLKFWIEGAPFCNQKLMKGIFGQNPIVSSTFFHPALGHFCPQRNLGSWLLTVWSGKARALSQIPPTAKTD